MATTDFGTLDTKDDWQDVLTNLVIAAAAACELEVGGSIAREAARKDLRDFRNFPCPFEDLRRKALEALNDLTLADINQALNSLNKLKLQLQEDKEGFKMASIAAASPRPQLRRAHAAIEELKNAQPELAAQLEPLQEALNRLLLSNFEAELADQSNATPSEGL